LVPSTQANLNESTSLKISRPGFAKLMSRVFDIDVLECPRCHSRMQIISFVHDPKVIKDILTSLKMATAPPVVSIPCEYSVVYDQPDLFMDDSI